MRKITLLLISLVLCSCVFGLQSGKKMDFPLKPFTSLADVVWCDESFTASLTYGGDGVLSISFTGENLEHPVIFSSGNGRQTIQQGDMVFSQPLDETLPSSVTSQFYTAITKLSTLEEVPPDENGDYIFSDASVHAKVSGDGVWEELVLENGVFKFNNFTFTT